MKLQIIYTFEEGQAIADFPFEPSQIETEKAFVDFAFKALNFRYCFFDSVEEYKEKWNSREVPLVVKLSACVFLYGSKIDEPEWFIKSNGKVYF